MSNLLWLPSIVQVASVRHQLWSSAVFCQACYCAALPEAAGRYGDPRIGAKTFYEINISRLRAGFPFPDRSIICPFTGLRQLFPVFWFFGCRRFSDFNGL